ncbi:MAG: DUF6175 family protein [Bacteroidales bacterium]
MKKLNLFFASLFLFASIATYAQNIKKEYKKLWASDMSYEVAVVGIGTDGTKLLKVWGYEKKAEMAKIEAKKNAVAACLFKGAVGDREKVVKPIIPDPSVADAHQAYFDKFFETGGNYLQYVAITTDASGSDIVKMDKGYKVGVVVSVMYDRLREEMERQGIVKKLSNVLGDKAKKPTIMVVPSDNWCIKNGFKMEFDNQGKKEVLPDYKAALQNNSDLLLVIGKLNTLMADRGFPLKNLESEMKGNAQEDAESNMLTSKESGSGIAESPIDKLKRTAKADIIMQLTWTVNTTGPKKSITFNLQGLDAYTNKQVAGAQGTGSPSFSTELPLLLEEAVLAHLDNFNSQLMAYFQDLAVNGREIKVNIKKFANWSDDLETTFEVDGQEDELAIHIENWFQDHAFNGSFNLADGTENQMRFEQVRIPLYYERSGKQQAYDARRFVSDLQNYLKKEPFNITSKIYMRGLGECWLILGEK